MYRFTGETQLPLLLCYILFFIFPLLFCFAPTLISFPPALPSYPPSPPHSRLSTLFLLFAHNPLKNAGAHGHVPVLLAFPALFPLFFFFFFYVISCHPLCVVMDHWNHTPLHPPLISPFRMCISSPHFTPFLLLLLSLLPSRPSLWGSLSPSYPLSAVPVGLWAGRVWAPAAFSKASAAAPATDPSNTATLTSMYTYMFVETRFISQLSTPLLSRQVYVVLHDKLSGKSVALCVEVKKAISESFFTHDLSISIRPGYNWLKKYLANSYVVYVTEWKTFYDL